MADALPNAGDDAGDGLRGITPDAAFAPPASLAASDVASAPEDVASSSASDAATSSRAGRAGLLLAA